MLQKYIHKLLVVLTTAIVVPVVIQSAALAYNSPVHTFSTNDVMGGFDGSTFGPTDLTGAATQDTSIICDLGPVACPPGSQPYIDKSGVKLYPTDSEFGFYIVDFLGAQGKIRDGDYKEGFVGDIEDAGIQVGIKISNAPTLKYKVKPPLGTWCQGLGGTSVKCETEHYSVMEHVLSCHETIPYSFADPVTGEHVILSTPDGSLTFNCANAPLDDVAEVLAGGTPTDRLINAVPCESGTPGVDEVPDGCQMFPNDKTDIQNNLALSSDYSVQLKDDGKPLYGWGGMHKRPNDVRMYAKLALPDEWKADNAPAEGYVVTRAELVMNHWITNNPNDQLRPEDLENEAAVGRKPSYEIDVGTLGTPDEVWRSLVPCYEGDGDLIDTEEGAIDPDFVDVGTYLRNMPFALDPAYEPGTDPSEPPYAFSSDLPGGFTNAFYTTINRDPFEWSYDADPDPLVQDFEGYAFPLSDEEIAARELELDLDPGELKLVSGPRWRLKPNKFGQDLPGLEIPLIECSKPPFKSDNIKYSVGTPVTTVINLLDWDEDEGPSPLATSKGWVDVNANEFVTVVDVVNGKPITSNGLPMSSDFDLAVYVKGDSKSTAVFNAQLIIEYEGETPQPPPTDFDLALTELEVPERVTLGETEEVEVEVTNNGPAAASGTVTLTGVYNRGESVEFTDSFDDLAAGDEFEAEWEWTAPSTKPSTINWTATVSTEGGDTNPTNDTATALTKVHKN